MERMCENCCYYVKEKAGYGECAMNRHKVVFGKNDVCQTRCTKHLYKEVTKESIAD